MKSKLENLPRYHTESVSLQAKLYNLIRLALVHKKAMIRFSIEGLRNIDILLDNDCWICVDSSLNDIPVFAWTDFQTENRDNLHLPIACKLYSYHIHAHLIVEPVKEAVTSKLSA